MAGGHSSPWPPAAGLTTQNVKFAEAILTTSASTRIAAPASLVFDAVLDVASYGKWNTFCPRVTVQSQPSDAGAEEGKLQIGTVFTFQVVMDEKKPTSETPTQLMCTDISTPAAPSSYIPPDVLKNEDSYAEDLSKVYRVGWRCEGGFVSRGLKTERFHEIIVLGENECEVRTWENQGGILAHTVKWLYRKTLDAKFKLWCADLKKYCEDKAKEQQTDVGNET
ncbi:hypothetical protein LTR37_009440 [Vermiconidia calcicola]|uniref:Uncharacterized protein n=1 Tax=Vermiconidia calcicola TaxID=1690605 RepID=A0ACC3N7T7_9PEZI|nr:hypothetical protein LTR37_009440 [Vermiconidia calcicola]